MVALAAAALSLLASCRGGAEDVPDAATADASLLPYRTAYRIHCAACHGRTGAGAAHLYPPLAGSPLVNGDPRLPIRVVLNGLDGRLTVLGEEYANKMPPLGERLEDHEIAGILTYVRASWGNVAGGVDPNTVASVRAAVRERDRPWTPPELDALFPESP